MYVLEMELVWLLLQQPKVNKVKIFLPFLKFMKRPQTKFHIHTMRKSQVIRQKKSNFIIRSKFSYNKVFSSLSIFY